MIYKVFARSNDGCGWILVAQHDNQLSALAEAAVLQLEGYEYLVEANS